MARMQAAAGTVQALAAVVSAGAEVAGVLPTITFLSSQDLKDKHKELQEKLNSLRAKMEDWDEVAKTEAMTKKTSNEYNDWEKRFRDTDRQVTQSLLSYESEIIEIDRWTDVYPRINLGAKIENDIRKIKKLKKELNKMRNILVPKQADRVVKDPSAPDIEGYESLKTPLKNILSALKLGKEVKGIQIHGILGIGKTTIMQNLNNHKEVADMFDIVIWLKVSTDQLDATKDKKIYSVVKLQRDVMHRLNIDDTFPVSQYKKKIWEELKDKKYLLLLDNVKDEIDTDEIGFPNNWEKGSKIVFTTRSKPVFYSIVDYSIKVEPLTPKEAQKLFLNILNSDVIRNDKRIMKLLVRVLEWCDGLPVAIKIVAGYFRSKVTEISWRNGLHKLHNLNSWPEYGNDKIKEMCRSLSFCCEELKGTHKDCFYYGALYPEEINIYKDRLLDCWIAELGTKGELDRAKGQSILEHLNDLNLLEEDERKKCVRMPKLIRLVALHNLQTDGERKCLVLSNDESLDHQNMDSWKGKHWISLANNKKLKIFSSTPDCSELSTLFLQGNSYFKTFPPSFFIQMGSLRVLDLMGTSIESLPDSVIHARKLAVLYLNECTNLLQLPSEIGNLELEVLDISRSGVKNVPREIQNLKHLKRILISSADPSETNSFSVISDLPNLEDMLIDVESEKDNYNWGIIDAVMESVNALTQLTSLQFRFLNDEVVDVLNVIDDVKIIYAHKEDNLKYFVEKEGLDSISFQIFIGCPISEDVKMPNSEEFPRYVKYCNGKKQNSKGLQVLSKADAVEIINQDDLENLSEFDFSVASAILLENCNRIKHIFYHHSIGLNLEQLYLRDLPELKVLWHGSIHLPNVRKLKILEVTRCPQLTDIITQAAVPSHERIVFPNLEELVLVEMQRLTSICENMSLEWPALKTVTTRECPALLGLPFTQSNAINLTSIIL